MSGNGAAPGGRWFRPLGETERLVAVPAADPAALLGALARELAPPYALVYVLLRPATLRPDGRYQSADPLPAGELDSFLRRFGPFLGADGRHGLAVISQAEPAAVTLDRRGVVEAHGDVVRLLPILAARGLVEGPVPEEPAVLPVDPARDAEELALLGSRRWTWFPLEPQDLVDDLE